MVAVFLFSSRRRHTRCSRDWSSDVCSSDLGVEGAIDEAASRDVALFCRRIGPQLEILRLRREISSREWLNQIGRASCRERVQMSAGAMAVETKSTCVPISTSETRPHEGKGQ